MSRDPSRLFENPDLPGELREALHEMAEVPPQPYDTAAGLARFQQTLGSGGEPTETPPENGSPDPSAAGQGGAASSGVGLGKIAAVGVASLGAAGVIVGLALGGGDTSEPPRATVPVAQSATPAKSRTPAPETPAVEDVPVITPEALPTAEAPDSAPPKHAPAKSKDQLYREELEHLAQLRRVAATRPAEAVRMADQGHARFAGGMLYQEREAIAIRSLARAGRSAQARARAQRFLDRFPKSPFSEQIRVAVGLSKP